MAVFLPWGGKKREAVPTDFQYALTQEILRTELIRIKALIGTAAFLAAGLSLFLASPFVIAVIPQPARSDPPDAPPQSRDEHRKVIAETRPGDEGRKVVVETLRKSNFSRTSTQVGTVVVVGYGVVAALFWFLFGYASYRGRDFRLSRTLWRGIRFDQKGNAWAYATRQFLWSLLVVVTAGLAYPFMSADLWRYRYTNTWYGDRQFSFTGSWRTIAGPFYRAYATVAILVGAALGVGFLTEGRALALVPLLAIILGFGGFFYYRAREASRMFSEVRLGTAGLRVEIKARALAIQFAAYSSMLLVGFIIVGLVGFLVSLVVQGQFDFSSLAGIARAGWIGVALALGGYLVSLATLGLMAEVYLDCGYWMLVARGATITGIESLTSVRAGEEDKALAGEGLADALNVGSF